MHYFGIRIVLVVPLSFLGPIAVPSTTIWPPSMIVMSVTTVRKAATPAWVRWLTRPVIGYRLLSLYLIFFVLVFKVLGNLCFFLPGFFSIEDEA